MRRQIRCRVTCASELAFRIIISERSSRDRRASSAPTNASWFSARHRETLVVVRGGDSGCLLVGVCFREPHVCSGRGIEEAVRSKRLAAAVKFAVVVLLALAMGVSPLLVDVARATTFARMSPEDMARAAVVIVRARCVGSVVETRGGEIWTVTSFEIRETWKGEAARVVRVRLLGGRTTEITSRVDGVPRFRAGEDVVLFLAPIENGEFSVLSWAQGTFRVSRETATGASVVNQDTASTAMAALKMATPATALSNMRPSKMGMGVGAGATASASHVAAIRNMPLEEFRRRIQEALSADAHNVPAPRTR